MHVSVRIQKYVLKAYSVQKLHSSARAGGTAIQPDRVAFPSRRILWIHGEPVPQQAAHLIPKPRPRLALPRVGFWPKPSGRASFHPRPAAGIVPRLLAMELELLPGFTNGYRLHNLAFLRVAWPRSPCQPANHTWRDLIRTTLVMNEIGNLIHSPTEELPPTTWALAGPPFQLQHSASADFPNGQLAQLQHLPQRQLIRICTCNFVYCTALSVHYIPCCISLQSTQYSVLRT